MMKIPPIIFSFVLKEGSVVSVKEHDSLKSAEKYVKFDIREPEPNEYCPYHIEIDNGSDLHTNATWVVDFKTKSPKSDELSKHRKENGFINNALKIVLREKAISKILDYENI